MKTSIIYTVYDSVKTYTLIVKDWENNCTHQSYPALELFSYYSNFISGIYKERSLAPVLKHPNFEKPIIIYTDASGAVLSKITEDYKEHVIAYASTPVDLWTMRQEPLINDRRRIFI